MTALTAAWQRALAAEQQAAFGYALLGPRLPAGLQALALSCQNVHEDLRDQTAATITALGVVPVAPLGDYPGLYPLAKWPGRLAAHLEDECAAAWRYLYSVAAASTASVSASVSARASAQRELTASAVRATQWAVRSHSARPVVAFPGI
jgi:hypothetical protein